MNLIRPQRPATRLPPASVRLAFVVLAGFQAAALEQPADSDVEEHTKVRLRTVRLRIEPTTLAGPGHCLKLESRDLGVSIRGEELDRRHVVDLERERQPTLHALLIDTSASMNDELDQARHAAAAYVRHLRLPLEKALLLTFDESVVMLQGVTEDRHALSEAVRGIRSGYGTSLLDALYYTTRELDAHPERGVIVLLTDGQDTASYHTPEEVFELAEARSDLTIFTIGLGFAPLTEVAVTREYLERLATLTHGRVFEVNDGGDLKPAFLQIRELLENEAILTLVDPDPETVLGEVEIVSRDPGCNVEVFRSRSEEADGPAGPALPGSFPELPHTLWFPTTATHLQRQMHTLSTDPSCVRALPSGSGRSNGTFEASSFFHVEDGKITGCALDVTMDHGLLYEPAEKDLMGPVRSLRLRHRPLEIPVPAPEALPAGPEEALDMLARRALVLPEIAPEPEMSRNPPEQHARRFDDFPLFSHGGRFLDMRRNLARALFLNPDYRRWALARLAAEADRQLAELMAKYRRYTPDLAQETLARLVRQTPDGKRILTGAASPTEVDLQPYLSAWLGDITAHELFARWEVELINRMLRSEASGSATQRLQPGWERLRSLLCLPSYVRVVTLLQPMHDRERDVIGYWRIVLPRPSWLRPSTWAPLDGRNKIPLDIVPDRPKALWVMERLRDRYPEIGDYLRDEGFGVTSVEYRRRGGWSDHDPRSGIGEVRVIVKLEARPGGRKKAKQRRLEVSASLGVQDGAGEPEVLDFELTGIGNRAFHRWLESQELLRRMGLR